ncbi:MAG TPA: hypothetical protein VII35_17660 [Steroidobacteraceae bacterium]
MNGVRIANRACLAALAVGLALPAAAGSAAAAAEAPVAAAQALQWRLVGPFRGGRTRAVTGIPGQPETFLIGAVNGGVWKTTDYGRTWNPVFDSAPTQSIGAIAVAPSDPSIIYVASGEGLARPDLSVGNGIYRSSDAGLNWTHLALDDAQQIPDLAVDPRDPNRLYAAVLGHPYGANAQRRPRIAGGAYPRFAAVIRPVHAQARRRAVIAFGGGRDRRIHAARLARCHRHFDLRQILRQALRQAAPMVATVGGLVESARRTGEDVLIFPRAGAHAPKGGIQHVRIMRIDFDAGTARVVIGVQYPRPVLPAIL